MMKRILSIFLLFLSLFFVGCGKNNEDVIRMGTGGTGGNYYNYGVNLSEALSNETDYGMEIIASQGSTANLRLISKGYLDMALVQSDILADAVNGKGNFSNNPLTGFHVVTGLYTESCQVIVREDSKINSIEDLAGKKVSVGEEASGAQKNALDILEAYGILTNVTISYNSYTESANALKNGEIDAFFCTASIPNTAVVDLSKEMDIKVLPIDENVKKRLIDTNTTYTESVIPAGTYSGQKEDIKTVGVTAVLIASDEFSKDIENDIVTLLKKRNEKLQKISFGISVNKEEKTGAKKVDLNMYMTLALAIGVLYLGKFLRKKIKILETFCIPAPVIGGLIFSIISCILYVTGIIEFNFDETFKDICMTIFFTSVGFQANLKVLKEGGKHLVIFLISIIVLIIMQNVLSVGISKVMDVSPLVGLCTGSIPMVGGHGTSGAFGLVLEDLGLPGATTLCTAAATFGLIMGSLMGGPIGRRLIDKNNLMKDYVYEEETIEEEEESPFKGVTMHASASYQIAIAMGIGTIVSLLLSKTGMTFPAYIGAMIVAAIMRNIGEYSGKFSLHMEEINDIGGICLSMFLGIAMITLKLWQLAELALPLFVLLIAQTVFMALYAYFIVYNIMGRNYDAAVLSAGTCGFGMGATPNAMANMQAITERYAPSVQAYLLVPIVGSMFADFINSLVVTFFINMV